MEMKSEARRKMSRPASSRSGRGCCNVQCGGLRCIAERAQKAGLDFAGNGARRYEDIGGGGEPIGLMVM